MKTSTQTISAAIGRRTGEWTEAWILGALAAVLSLLASSGSAGALVLSPAAWQAGEWWRWVTHPFVHVSFYHMLLDAGAFLSLYGMLTGWSAMRRLSAVAVCVAGSALAAAMNAEFARYGLCGLSGAGHGLMALIGLHWWREGGDRVMRRMGVATLFAVAAKSAWEACTGHVLFEFLHFGSVGTPIAVCHLGGVVAGVIYGMGVAGMGPAPRRDAAYLEHVNL